MNEKKLKKLDLIKKKKPYYYYAYKTISCPMQFSVFLHEQCIEEYMIWKPSTINDYYNYEYNDLLTINVNYCYNLFFHILNNYSFYFSCFFHLK